MATHWRDRTTGFLCPPVELKTKPGQYRDFDLRDARKVGALPSVTNYLGLLNKPALTKWQVMQGIKAASRVNNWDWTLTETSELDPAVLEATYQDAQAYLRYTQDFGEAFHWHVSHKLKARDVLEIPPMVAGAEECADAFLLWSDTNGYEWEYTERVFANPELGVGGAADLTGLHYGQPCIADPKTQEPPLTPHSPEYPLQLSGYSQGLLLPLDVERISLICNRLNPGEVYPHLWKKKEETIEQANAKWDSRFLKLRDLWIDLNEYDPREQGGSSADTNPPGE